MSPDFIACKLGGYRCGGGWMALCPAHEDREPSLSIRDGKGGRLLVYCRKERVKAIVEMAIRRFNAFDRLQRELDATKAELAGRKVIERAKGILMRTRQIGEEEAYALLRQASMSENRKVSDVAQAVVTAASLLEK